MSRKKEKKIVLSELEPEERLKYEIAEELGLLDQVMEKGGNHCRRGRPEESEES